MSIEPLSPPPNTPMSLAKLAIVFAVVCGIAFGLCTVSVFTGGLGSQGAMPFLIYTSVLIEAVCLVGLVVVGFWAVARSLNRKS